MSPGDVGEVVENRWLVQDALYTAKAAETQAPPEIRKLTVWPFMTTFGNYDRNRGKQHMLE